MRVMAQLGMVMNLDKCIGCHTCSVTCKQAWTNRAGVEYVWFNNVETRPGQGYPRRYAGPGAVAGRLGAQPARAAHAARPAAGSAKLLSIFANPVLPNIRDYYEPWTYDYETLTDAPLGDDFPVAQPKSLLTGEPMADQVERQLGRRPRRRARARAARPDRAADPRRVRGQGPASSTSRRSCSTCRGSASTASTRPAWRPARPGRCTSAPRTASCWSTRTSAAAGGCASPAARTRRSTSTTAPARPRSARSATRGSRSGCRPCARETCVGRLRYLGLFLYDADRVTAAASVEDEHDLYEAQLDLLLDPHDPAVIAAARRGRHRRGLDRRRPALAGVPAGQGVPGGAAAAPGVPHDADGLVHPAAVAGGRRAHRDRPRRRGRRQPVRRDRRAAHPDRVPRRAVHRRRPRAGAPGAAQARRDALLHARRHPRTGRATSRSPPRSG